MLMAVWLQNYKCIIWKTTNCTDKEISTLKIFFFSCQHLKNQSKFEYQPLRKHFFWNLYCNTAITVSCKKVKSLETAPYKTSSTIVFWNTASQKGRIYVRQDYFTYKDLIKNDKRLRKSVARFCSRSSYYGNFLSKGVPSLCQFQDLENPALHKIHVIWY